MNSMTLTLELDAVSYTVVVHYHYHPPFYSVNERRVPPNVDIEEVVVKSRTDSKGTVSRDGLVSKTAADMEAYQHIEEHRDKYKEMLIAQARS